MPKQGTPDEMNTKLVAGIIAVSIFCFVVGNVTGFVLGVWSRRAENDFLKDVLSDEEPADLGRPRQMVREGY